MHIKVCFTNFYPLKTVTTLKEKHLFLFLTDCLVLLLIFFTVHPNVNNLGFAGGAAFGCDSNGFPLSGTCRLFFFLSKMLIQTYRSYFLFFFFFFPLVQMLSMSCYRNNTAFVCRKTEGFCICCSFNWSFLKHCLLLGGCFLISRVISEGV